MPGLWRRPQVCESKKKAKPNTHLMIFELDSGTLSCTGFLFSFGNEEGEAPFAEPGPVAFVIKDNQGRPWVGIITIALAPAQTTFILQHVNCADWTGEAAGWNGNTPFGPVGNFARFGANPAGSWTYSISKL